MDSNPRYSVQRIRDSVDIVDEELRHLGGLFQARISELEALDLRWMDLGEKMREIAFAVEYLQKRPGKILRRAAAKATIDNSLVNDDDRMAMRVSYETANRVNEREAIPSEIISSQLEMKDIAEKKLNDIEMESESIRDDDRILRTRAAALESDLEAVWQSCKFIEGVASELAMDKIHHRIQSLRYDDDDLFFFAAIIYLLCIPF